MSAPIRPNTPEFNQQLFDISCRLAKWYITYRETPVDPNTGILLAHELEALLVSNNVDFSNS